jgi:hypothetical protein
VSGIEQLRARREREAVERLHRGEPPRWRDGRPTDARAAQRDQAPRDWLAQPD